ncbi:MAG: EAL domain-containing protein [Acidimicrobiales bacterium]
MSEPSNHQVTLMDVLQTIEPNGATNIAHMLETLCGAVDAAIGLLETDTQLRAVHPATVDPNAMSEFELNAEMPSVEGWLTVRRDSHAFTLEEQAIVEASATALDSVMSADALTPPIPPPPIEVVARGPESAEAEAIMPVKSGDEGDPVETTTVHTPLGELDGLTGLLTRDAFRDLLDSDLDADLGSVAVLAIGIDALSIVNDTLGYSHGDRVLQTIAARLRTAVRDCDVVARIGDDVFGVYCPGMDVDLGADVLDRLQIVVGSPLDLDQGRLSVTASGSVVASAHGVTADEMLVRADAVMRLAKTQGGGAVLRYDGDLARTIESKRTLSAELQHAMAHNLLTTSLDPIVALPSGETMGREARVRWMHAERGILERDDFMQLVESIGRVADIERAVVAFAHENASAGEVTAVNISGSSLRTPHQIDWILDRFDTADIAQSLIVDVSEDAVASSGSIGLESLDRLRERGIGVVLDDFGKTTGSIRTLLAFPYDGVRVHPSFVAEPDPARVRAVLRAVLVVAEELGFSVIHAGVDTEQHFRQLRRLYESMDVGVFYAQGRIARHHTIPEILRDTPAAAT